MKVLDISGNRLGVDHLGELFGIEIEVENVRIPNCEGSLWTVIEDGSLRNSGFEFVSRPCTYDDALAGIVQFYGWMSEYAYNTSVRTSTHVHYNVLDYTLEELSAALTTYSIVEPLLFRVCGEMREEGIYCVPWYRAPNEAKVARMATSGQPSMVEMSCKYSALYLEPVQRFGTVEFRHAPVFDDADTLMFWIDLVRAVMIQGRAFGTGQNVLDRLESLGTREFVESVFGEDLGRRLLTICSRSFEEIIDDCDSISVAEACVPSSYTYKVTEGWDAVASADGDNATGYHRTRVSSISMYDLDEMEMHNPDEEEYHEEEW